MIKITKNEIARFAIYLREQERSKSTIQKYTHDVTMLSTYLQGNIRDKKHLISFKEYLLSKGYAVSSINSMLAAVNQFLVFLGHPDLKLRFLKIQKTIFSRKEKELTREEYEKMICHAEKTDRRLSLLLQTICSTGIRVSELNSITVESLKRGYGQITSKGKIRQILFPKELCKTLLAYCRQKRIKAGNVFITKTGRPLDRSNIWKMMKRLSKAANIASQKVYPHNLRHLFARSYYQKYKDIVRLADILGHSSVDTTRIYTSKSGDEQQRQIGSLHLILYKKERKKKPHNPNYVV